MDSKQRLIINTRQNGRQVICAEPSPDTVSTLDTGLGTSAGADLGIAGKAVGITGIEGTLKRALNEDTETLTTRTAGIQVLRDGLYRACEAYVNGLVGKKEYGAILGAYDEILIALMAIDSLQVSAKNSKYKEVQYQAIKSTEQIVRDYYCMKISGSQIERDKKIEDRMCKE